MNQDEIKEFMNYVCNCCCSHIGCDRNDKQYANCLEDYKKEILEE